LNRGLPLLNSVAERVLVRWLIAQGRPDAVRTSGKEGLGGHAVDITYTRQGSLWRVKVKADPYCGTDSAMIADRSLAFYREDGESYAFEAVANVATREPGWMIESDADELYYYYLGLGQPEEEVRALSGEADGALFAGLNVVHDELVVLPMRETRAWFQENFERFTPRPVLFGGGSGWYRLVPRAELDAAVPSIRSAGPIFRSLVG
jgi:hypothetical protein